MVEAQAVACGKGRGFEAGRKGLVMDVEGTEAAAMLRRGCVAAVVGASAFALPAAQIGDPAAPVATDANEPFRNSKRRKGGNAVGHLPEFLKQKSEGLMTEGNELLKVSARCILIFRGVSERLLVFVGVRMRTCGDTATVQAHSAAAGAAGGAVGATGDRQRARSDRICRNKTRRPV